MNTDHLSPDDVAVRLHSVRDSMAEKARAIVDRKVDRNGRPVPAAIVSTATDVTANLTTDAPSMGAAIVAAASAVGADVGALTDSTSFLRLIGPLAPTDSVGIQEAILGAMSANPSLATATAEPRMKPNPAQGSSGSGAMRPVSSNPLERIRAEMNRGGTSHIPPGYAA